MVSTRARGAKKTPAGAEISKTPTKNSKANTAARKPTPSSKTRTKKPAPSSSKPTGVSRRKKADVFVEVEEPNVEEGPDEAAATTDGSSRPKRKASRGVQLAVAALNGDVTEEDEGVEEAPVEEAAGSDGSDVDMEAEDGGSYEPEETARDKGAKRKAKKGAVKSKSKSKAVAAADEQKPMRKPTYCMPDLVERAWYQAGSVIIGQLRALIGDDVEAIRQSKVLLEMDLVAPDAFAEVWGGRPDLMTLKKAELVKLGQASGIKGLSKPLAKARGACKALRYLSAENYKLWRAAEEREIWKAARQNVLPDEPLWLEKLINADSSIYCVYKTAVKKSLRLPDDMLGVMRCVTSSIRMRGYRGYWYQTVYLYRASVAISVAVRWREFNGKDELDIGSVVREDDNFQESLNMEKKLREDIMGRVDLLRKEWKKAGAVEDLDEVLESGGLDNGRYHHTKEFIASGETDQLQLAVKAMKAVKKWGNPDERDALKTEERLGRFKTLSAAFKKNKLAVPAELDPAAAGVAGSEAHRVRQQLNISWDFISVGRAMVDDSVKAHKAWLEYHGTYSVSNESAALALVPKMARWTKLAETWDAACGFSVEDVNPGRGTSDAARRALDVTVAYIERGIPHLDRVRQAHAAYVEYKELRDTESQAVAHEGQLERCEEVKAAWVEHKLDDADQLCVPVPPEIAEKYHRTTGYILGTTNNLDGVIAARLLMRDKKLGSELVSLALEDLKRHPHQNHVFVCPCGYYAGESKMNGHLRLNRTNAVPDHKKGY